MRRLTLTVILLGALLIPTGTATAAPPVKDVRARVIGTLDDGITARTINKHGEVAFSAPSTGPAVWDASSGSTRALERASNAVPQAITDDGRVVGAGDGELVIWGRDGRPTTIGHPVDDKVERVRMNNDGTVMLSAYHIVWVNTPRGPRPEPVVSYYRWQPEAGFQRLAVNGERSRAEAINDEGVIVGRTSASAVRWQPDGTTVTQVPLPGETRPAWALGINNRDVVVGAQQRADLMTITPVRWDTPTEPHALSDFGLGGEATAINDRGWIVGTVYVLTDKGRTTTPAVWDGHGDVHRLDELLEGQDVGGTVSSIEGVNNRNQLLLRVWKPGGAGAAVTVVQLT
ncbi:hypothetical protein [Streptomyces griseocarneus]|uniref:hypothetical protein n=1 Tax=Streptomyces griseocarneus TaxID=51201 RepID=UPI00167ED39F|nr:hypothetical protein [Streptomyces griseocarneus]MBZ6475017.1 DUF3466 family protein [Streptomyces griseocarneus]GHG62754.1 hypothetical protein GCM10018779_31750 [Streptomyces griseocarneus]